LKKAEWVMVLEVEQVDSSDLIVLDMQVAMERMALFTLSMRHFVSAKLAKPRECEALGSKNIAEPIEYMYYSDYWLLKETLISIDVHKRK